MKEFQTVNHTPTGKHQTRHNGTCKYEDVKVIALDTSPTTSVCVVIYS